MGWRKHFISVMKPNFLPNGWAITSKTNYSDAEFEIFKAYEAQVKAFQEGVSDARDKLPKKDLSAKESWVREAYETGYSLTKGEKNESNFSV
jgi:hypothetical protein